MEKKRASKLSEQKPTIVLHIGIRRFGETDQNLETIEQRFKSNKKFKEENGSGGP
jgi:hypothetical protein